MRGCEPSIAAGALVAGTPVTMVVEGDVAVVRVVGDLDLGTHELFLDCLASGLALARDVLVVDLSACGFVGGRPFRAIEDAATFLQDRGAVLVVRDPPASFAIISGFLHDSCAFRVERRSGTGLPSS